MKAPKCRLCGAQEHGHVCFRPDLVDLLDAMPSVSHTAEPVSHTYRYRDADTRRAYMKELMKRRRVVNA